jgi:adenylate cyclase
MVEAHANRRLAAILAADVVGYSRMMASDEAGTLAALKRHRESVFDPAVAEHSGRIVKLIGDGTLVEFGSVVDAVKCALAVQIAARNQGEQSAAGNIVLRIGINLGDVIIEGEDIYGDGVNVAARLEPLADPGGVCVSSIVNESVGNRIEFKFEDGGEVQLKNIDRPIRIWKWRPSNVVAKQSPVVGAMQKAPRDTPSIAVLPFDNMSGDAEHEYFCDGMTEDIITDLSKISGLLVVARNSSFAYKGKKFDVRNVARELGVRFVLEGSIRRAGNRIRINAQLINASSGLHLWAERYDRDLTDIFELQDDVTRRIVATLRITLTPSEDARLADGGTKSLEAHDCYLRAGEFLFGKTKNRETFDEATKLLNRAIELDPGYAEAYAGLGLVYIFDSFNRWSEDSDGALQRAKRCADQAIEKDPNEPFGHLVAARVAMYEKDLDRAKSEAGFALSLNPNYALAHYTLGCIQMYLGRPMDAVPLIERAMRLDPAFTHQYLHFLGSAYLVAGKFETASVVFKQRILLVPDTDLSRAFLASALGHFGQIDEARQIWRELKAVNPEYSFDEHIGKLPFKVQADVDRIREGLTKAGLPN